MNQQIYKYNMNKLSTKHGFTLIEMLVVVAIISILAGVVLTGVTGFQANARDTKRIADLKQMQSYLELYYNKEGQYPSSSVYTTWATWNTHMDTELSVNIPVDPIDSAGYKYFYGIDDEDFTKYILGAGLERENQALNNPGDLDKADVGAKETLYDITYVFTDSLTSDDCEDDSVPYGYCTE